MLGGDIGPQDGDEMGQFAEKSGQARVLVQPFKDWRA